MLTETKEWVETSVFVMADVERHGKASGVTLEPPSQTTSDVEVSLREMSQSSFHPKRRYVCGMVGRLRPGRE